MIKLDVWLTLPSGESIKAGALVIADPDNVKGAQFSQHVMCRKKMPKVSATISTTG